MKTIKIIAKLLYPFINLFYEYETEATLLENGFVKFNDAYGIEHICYMNEVVIIKGV